MPKKSTATDTLWTQHEKSYKAFMKKVLKKKKQSNNKKNLKKKLVKCVAPKVEKI